MSHQASGTPSVVATSVVGTDEPTDDVKNGNNIVNPINQSAATVDQQQHPLAAAVLPPLHSSATENNNSSPTPKEWVKFEDVDIERGSTPVTTPQAAISPDTAISPRVVDSTATAAAAERLNTSNNNNGGGGAVVTQQLQQVNPTPPPRAHQLNPAAVLATESVHVNVINKPTSNNHPNQNNNNNNHHISTSTGSNLQKQQSPMTNLSGPAVIDIPISSAGAGSTSSSNPGLRTIELSSGRIREGFANGDIIVTLLPVNTKWPWITPAVFRPELVPEELMAQGLTLTVEEYVHAMETLVNDYRFTLYNVCYKRILCCWILFAFSVLMGLLFSGLNGIALFSLGVGWLFLNASAIFLCMWMKLRLSRGLERCMASVNKQLLRHKIILVLDDRGKISCHKVNLCFMYYEPTQCIGYLNEFIARNEQNGTAIEAGWESRLDVPANDIVIQGSNTTRVSRKQDRGELLLLRYAARWGRDVMRGMADVSVVEPARHCAPFVCPCQYVERHLTCKPRGKSKYFIVCDGLCTAESCDSLYFIFFSISLILGLYTVYTVAFRRRLGA